MKKLAKHKVIFWILSAFFTSSALSADLILPAPKPSPDLETRNLVEKKKQIYPEKKPNIKKNLTEAINNDELSESDNSLTSKINIYPEKKPVVFKEPVNKPIIKSSILSTKDFNIAKSAFEAIDKKKWKTALKISKKAKDKSLYNLVSYLYLIKANNTASFYDYSLFINKNQNYPRINRLRYLGEHKINLNTNTPLAIMKWFGDQEPLSSYGKIKLGEMYLIQNKEEEGSKLIKAGWIQARLSKGDLKYLRNKYRKIITVEDNVKRADWHAWEGKHWDVQRMLRYLPKDYTTLYKARQILMSQSYGVDSAIAKVSDKFKNDIGLQYDRLKWRRKRGRLEPSLEILFQITKDPKKLIRPDIWWKERAILARSLIYKKKFALAYKVSSNHSMNEGPEYAEAEWLSGWIALTFLDDPNYGITTF